MSAAINLCCNCGATAPATFKQFNVGGGGGCNYIIGPAATDPAPLFALAQSVFAAPPWDTIGSNSQEGITIECVVPNAAKNCPAYDGGWVPSALTVEGTITFADINVYSIEMPNNPPSGHGGTCGDALCCAYCSYQCVRIFGPCAEFYLTFTTYTTEECGYNAGNFGCGGGTTSCTNYEAIAAGDYLDIIPPVGSIVISSSPTLGTCPA